MRKPLFLAPLLVLAACGPQAPEPPLEWSSVKPDDPLVQYTGRVDFSRPSPRFAHAGVSLRVRFQGRGLSVKLKEDSYGGAKRTNYYNLLVDGEAPVRIETPPGEQALVLVSGLAAGEHTVELYKRTEASVGTTEVRALEVLGTLLEPPARPSRRLTVIGDSITCAYGNEVSIPAPPEGDPNTDFRAANQNFYESYAAIVARTLGAELHNVCYSARGLYRNLDHSYTGTLPDLYELTLPDEPDSRWDQRQYEPEVILINLGTNDFSTLPSPEQESFEAAAERFVRRLRHHHPRAHILFMTGPILNDFFPRGAMALTSLNRYLNNVVLRLRDQGEDRLYLLPLKPQDEEYGEDWHPTRGGHQQMANELLDFLRPRLGW